MVVRWQFFDPVLDETLTMELNPNSGGSPSFDKTITEEATTAPDGQTIIFEGQDPPQKLEWSGVILTQTHYEAYATWYQKRRQIKLTDDLGREFWIYITSFAPKRVRKRTVPWFHEFTCRATILDVT